MATEDTTPAIQGATRLRRAFATRPIDECELKAAVLAYVDDRKRVGQTVERTIIDIKRIAEAENAPGAVSDLRNPPPRHLSSVKQAVTWCIEHYFDGDGATE